jgi:xanthine dehydrogenase accessory factor
MSDWLQELRKLQAAGEDCVRVTVMDVRGSAPREIGATMLVTAEDLRGSIGGGRLEHECARLAAERLRSPGHGPARMTFPLGAAMGQCCGGVVDVLFEYLPAAGSGPIVEALQCFRSRTPAVLVTSIGASGEVSRSLVTGAACEGDEPDDATMAEARRILRGGIPATCLRDADTRTLLEPIAETSFHLALFGAGHVGSALVSILASLDCRLRWIDGRRDIFPETVPDNVTCVESEDPAREALAMPPGAYWLVMTHSHALDYEICEQILARDDFAWCGLIGSRSKRRRFEKRLRAQGMSEARIDSLVCPIGIPGLDGKKPAEIAVSAAAQLLQIRKSRAVQDRGIAARNVHALRR